MLILSVNSSCLSFNSLCNSSFSWIFLSKSKLASSKACELLSNSFFTEPPNKEKWLPFYIYHEYHNWFLASCLILTWSLSWTAWIRLVNLSLWKAKRSNCSWSYYKYLLLKSTHTLSLFLFTCLSKLLFFFFYIALKCYIRCLFLFF